MRVIEGPELAPHRCAAFPSVGAGHPGRFVDTGSDLFDGFTTQRVYLSDLAVVEAAGLLGLVDGVELKQRVSDLEREIEGMRAEVAEARALANAVDVMESAGFTARKKPGRPAKQTVEV